MMRRAPMRDVRFDDIDTLRGFISEDFGPWGPEIRITQDMIQRFAEVTGDDQWIHTDVERARRESPFGGPIAHGFLTLSLLARLRGDLPFRLTGYGNVTNYGADSLRFLAPVPSESRLHARSRLVEVKARPTGTLLTLETMVHVVENVKPSLLYKGLALYQSATAESR
jgi:acyl dehydratase